jgi:phosphohistidine phosphatase SixA
MRQVLARLTALSIAFAAVWPAVCGAQELKGEALFAALKQGGYVIYLRHATSDAAQNDADPIKRDDCQTQRNLSEEGRVQAKAIGKAMSALGIAADKVLSSPYCRTIDTGKLAFGAAQAADALYYSEGLSPEAAAQALAELKRMLGAAPAAGKNTVLVGHTSNLKAAAGVWPRSEGAAVVLQPKADGSFGVVGSFSAAEIIKAAG